MKPMYGRVLVFPHDGSTEEEDESQFQLTEGSKPKPTRGTVLAVGHGHRAPDGTLIPLKVQVDDVIVFNKYSGIKIEDTAGDETKELKVINEDEILCIETSPSTT